MLDIAKLQIREVKVEIAHLTDALRESTKKDEEAPKKQTIDYNQELLGSYASQLSSDEASSRDKERRLSRT